MDARVPATPDERLQLRDFFDRTYGPGRWRSDGMREIGLWHHGRLIAAIPWQREADDSAVLWHPKGLAGGIEPESAVMSALFSAAAEQARQAGCRFALVYLERGDSLVRQSLKIAQFSRLTDFLCLNRPLEADQSAIEIPPGTEVDYRAETRGRFADVFARTQCDSQDGAAFGDLRSPWQFFEILSSSAPPREAGDWTLWERHGRGFALLLLNEHWSGTCLEISYLGVVPDMRRRGVGRYLIETALGRARDRQFHSVEANVDTGNVGARGLYHRLGFCERSRHEVFIKRW